MYFILPPGNYWEMQVKLFSFGPYVASRFLNIWAYLIKISYIQSTAQIGLNEPQDKSLETDSRNAISASFSEMPICLTDV